MHVSKIDRIQPYLRFSRHGMAMYVRQIEMPGINYFFLAIMHIFNLKMTV